MAPIAVDYSAGVPSAAAIKDFGAVAALRYISPARASWMAGKPMSRAEADDLKSHGLEIVSIYQNLKEDWRRGVAGGYQDGLEAIKGHRSAGGPEGCVIYCAIDSNPTESEWNATAKPYVLGFREALREHGFRIGIYCNTSSHRWADRDGIPHYWWAHNWGSDDTTAQAHIHQFEIDKQAIAGVGIDRNYLQHDDYGQWSKATGQHKEVAPVSAPIIKQAGRQGDPTWLPEVLKAFGVTVKEMDGWLQWGEGDFTNIDGVVAHHTAGPNTSAEYIARNPGIGNSLSSQIHLARDGVATLCGVGIAYHAGEAVHPPEWTGYVTRNSAGNPRKSFTKANAVTIGIEAVNSGDGSQPWPDVQMDAYARICAAILWYLDLPISKLQAHKEIAPSRKIDPNFNMDAFRVRTKAYMDNPPFDTITTTEGDLTVSEADRIIEFIKGWTGPQGSDIKDVRAQLTGGRDAGEYPGWPQLGQNEKGQNLTVTDAIAALRQDVARVEKKIDDLEGK